MFDIGQKVVCVHGSVDFNLIEGTIYTISDFGPHTGRILYDLAEVKTDVPHAWLPTRFKPVYKTDISIFQSMLTKLTQKQGA